jgi:hypothetical protein
MVLNGVDTMMRLSDSDIRKGWRAQRVKEVMQWWWSGADPEHMPTHSIIDDVVAKSQRGDADLIGMLHLLMERTLGESRPIWIHNLLAAFGVVPPADKTDYYADPARIRISKALKKYR